VIPDETVDKRWWRENWFQPVVRIGALGNYEHVLQQPPPCLSFTQTTSVRPQIVSAMQMERRQWKQ
jgi:hypothetical protein